MKYVSGGRQNYVEHLEDTQGFHNHIQLPSATTRGLAIDKKHFEILHVILWRPLPPKQDD